MVQAMIEATAAYI